MKIIRFLAALTFWILVGGGILLSFVNVIHPVPAYYMFE